MTLFHIRAKYMHRRWRETLLAGLWACACLPLANGQDTPGSGGAGTLGCQAEFVPADGSYEFSRNEPPRIDGQVQGLRFGEVHLTRLPIFDESNPEEDRALFRWANNFHILTRPATIQQQLLFSEGEPFSQRLMEESARLLRQRGYFYDADVRAVSRCNERVDVEVISKDNWSLTPSISFDRLGGENTYSFGLRDSNLLGYGKLLSISDGKDIDRRSTEIYYQDHNLYGTRLRSDIALVNSDDGDSRELSVDLPFYSLDSRQAWAVRVLDEERIETQYFRSEEVTEVRHEEQRLAFELGFSSGLQDSRVQRWRFGLRYREDRYSPGDALPAPGNFPTDRELVYPFVALQAIEDDYVTAFNLDQIYRTEDLHLGYEFQLELGYASRGLGSDRDRLVFNGYFSDSLHYDDDSFWQHEADWEGFYNRDSSELENVLVSYRTRYFRRQTSQRSFFAQLEAVYSKNLDGHRQVVLGGQTGARAFENRYQVGDSRVLVTLEERLYTDLHLLNLVRVGGALFVDAGRSWSADAEIGSDQAWLTDIGFGLRLASSKAASDRIAHLDFAFPLTNQNDPTVDSVLISFTVKGSF